MIQKGKREKRRGREGKGREKAKQKIKTYKLDKRRETKDEEIGISCYFSL